MGFVKALVVLQLSLLCFTVFSAELDIVTQAPPPIPPHGHGNLPHVAPAQPPAHHHHHHQHLSHPPSPAPLHTPSHAPVHPPAHHHHHAHPPTSTPAHPPIHPPAHVPTHPPVHPPSYPPPHPPIKPPSYHSPRSFVAVQGVVYCKSCKYAGVGTLWGATPVLGATVKLQCNNTKYPQVVMGKTDKNGYFYFQAPKTVTNYGAHKCKASLVSSPLASCSIPSDLHGGVTGAILRPEKPFIANKLPFVLYSVGPFAFEPKCPR